MATAQATVRELRALGKEGTARIYARHGVSDPALGVSYASLATLVKRIGVDHRLALELWDTGVHEARVLATKIADPGRLSRAQVARWLNDASDYAVTDAVSGLAARASEAPAWAELWVGVPHEWTSAAGWNVFSILAMDGRIDPFTALHCLARIRRDIARAPNRTRYSMNGALISIGGSLPELTERALRTARAIGRVEVDHGRTGCRTPDAAAYIRKMRAHRTREERARVTGARTHARTPASRSMAARKK